MRIQVSSGQGPAECELVVGLLSKQFQKERTDTHLIQSIRGRNVGGYSSILFKTEENVRELEGSVLWVCESSFRPGHKRKNQYIDMSTLGQLPDMAEDIQLCSETFRSGREGRQHVSRVGIGVRAIHIPTGVSAVSTKARSQHMNKKLAINHLYDILSEKNPESRQKERGLAWLEHTRLGHGNPVRIYKGIKLIGRK